MFYLDVFHFGSDSKDFEVEMPSFSSTFSQPLTNFSTYGSSDCFGMSQSSFQGLYYDLYDWIFVVLSILLLYLPMLWVLKFLFLCRIIFICCDVCLLFL